MRTRTLSLKKETLVELSTEELTEVAGGADLSGLSCPVCSDFASCIPTHRCLTFNGC